jgi:hypothetical protein
MIPNPGDVLQSSAAVIEALVHGVGVGQAKWRPDSTAWSILEVVNHLHDEEREDFRQRLRLTLEHPDQAWPPIDPAGWVTSRNYQDRDLEPSLASFLAERRRSIEWLAELREPNWESTHEHPTFGGMKAGDLLASWIAHDSLHIRQLTRLHFLYRADQCAPYRTRYAGEW